MRMFRLLVTITVLALAPPSTSADEPPPHAPQAEITALETKLAELERQLLELRKEVQELRRRSLSKPEVPSEKADVAWGMAADGLQAGLALRAADRHSYEVGDTVQFVVKLRNLGERPIEMRYEAVEPGARIGPSVLDADGNRPAMSGPVYIGVGGRAISKLTLAPGQEVEFAAPELALGPPEEVRVKAKATLQAGPGTYRVSYNVYYLNADETGAYLSTGEVDVKVTPKAR
jgi:hypothetical protein